MPEGHGGPLSVAFDRAAAYYDETRGLSTEGVRRQAELLAGELADRGRVLEVGVGTGQVALPLHGAGIPVVGLDLARPMMDVLVRKAGGRAPFPLVQGDATRMPFADHTYGVAYLRWVLHLIPNWRAALAEMVRVVEPGGAILVLIGGYGGISSEIQERFAELAGISLQPPGLAWRGYEELDAAMASLGAVARALPPFTDVDRDGLDTLIAGIAGNRYSWTWKVDDPDVLARVANEVERWAEERFGPLDRVPRQRYEVTWRAYDLPT